MGHLPNSYCNRRVFNKVRVPNPISMAKSQGSILNQKGIFLVILIFPKGIVNVKSKLQSIPQQFGGCTHLTMCRMAAGRFLWKSKEIGQSINEIQQKLKNNGYLIPLHKQSLKFILITRIKLFVH